jgi:hypothetical protein
MIRPFLLTVRLASGAGDAAPSRGILVVGCEGVFKPGSRQTALTPQGLSEAQRRCAVTDSEGRALDHGQILRGVYPELTGLPVRCQDTGLYRTSTGMKVLCTGCPCYQKMIPHSLQVMAPKHGAAVGWMASPTSASASNDSECYRQDAG